MADDWLAAGLIAFSSGDVGLAEKLLDKAKSSGTDITPYLGSLAAAAFAESTRLLREQEFAKADATLVMLEHKYGETPWFAANKTGVEGLRARVHTDRVNAEAEKLYAQAAKLFNEHEFYDLKPLVEQLKTDYPSASLMTDASRKPSVAEMTQATVKLGKLVTVPKDGKGDYTSIQAAIDKAPPNSTIEIQDNGPYYEVIFIAKDTPGLTVRGKKPCWPLILSNAPAPAAESQAPVVRVEANNVTIQRLTIVSPEGPNCRACVLDASGNLRSRLVVFAGGNGSQGVVIHANCDVKDSVFFHSGEVNLRRVPCVMQNCVCRASIRIEAQGSEVAKVRLDNVVAPRISSSAPAELRFCTVGILEVRDRENQVADSILNSVIAKKPNTSIDFCCMVSGKYVEEAKPGKNCFSADPQFSNPAVFDFRLSRTSPCRGKAPDGGDLGVRYTPEMLEMIKIALELRAKGIIKF